MMKRVREESRASNNGGLSQNNMIRSLDEEVPYPPLNLPLTKSPELIKKIESLLQQQQHQHLSNTTPNEKQKAMNFPITKITIGEWTRDAVYEQDLKAKIYFAKKKIIWECLEDVTTETTMRLNRKIEMKWTDVLSLKPLYHSHDQTEILKLELRKPPTFFIETNPQSGKHTLWKQMDQDFTLNHSASRNRIHTLHFAPGVLKKHMKKLVAVDKFWSELFKVRFPTSEDLYFDIEYGNSKNNNSIDSSGYSHGQTLSFDVNNELQHHSQGVRCARVDTVKQFRGNHGTQTNSYVEDNFQNNTMKQFLGKQVIQPNSYVEDNFQNNNTMKQFLGTQVIQPNSYLEGKIENNTMNQFLGTQVILPNLYVQGNIEDNTMNQLLGTEGIDPNSYVQGNIEDNTVNQLLGTEVNRPRFQLITEPYNMGEFFLPGSHLYDSIYQDMSNTGELLGTQAYSHTLLETQTNSTMFQYMNEPSMYPHQVGSYEGYLGQEGERHNLEHTQVDGNFQINHNQQFGGYDYSQYISSNYGLVFPDIDIGDDLNGQGL